MRERTPAQIEALFRDYAQVKEKVERLCADRGADKKPLSAVQRGELLALASIGMKSTTVSSTPTADEYNALRTDVKNIFDALKKISNLLGNADIPKV